jgi:cytidine diphosphoramidate kinase
MDREAAGMTGQSGSVIWITGYSGAGKTTLAKALLARLQGRAILLDGDELRQVLGQTGGSHDYDGRKRLAFIYARFAGLLASQGATVVVATISLFHDVHDWNRANLPGYVEVFLDVPEAERRRRDPKGLYKQDRSGESAPMACQCGVEPPRNPHVSITPQDHPSVESAVAVILRHIHGQAAAQFEAGDG